MQTKFAIDLDEYVCDVALAIRYFQTEAFNTVLPKSHWKVEHALIRIQ